MNHTYTYTYYIDGNYKGVPSFKYYKYYKDEKRNEYNYLYGIKTGIKWECIEFIRRYFTEKHRLTFELVDNVYDMLNIKYFINLDTLKPIFLNFYPRNPNFKPKVDDLVLFYYKNTGHIAIISNISNISKYYYVSDEYSYQIDLLEEISIKNNYEIYLWFVECIEKANNIINSKSNKYKK